MPHKACVELKSLKLYIHAYRNVGIFYENAVNRILQDFVKACKPEWAVVTGTFTARGGLSSTIRAQYPQVKTRGPDRLTISDTLRTVNATFH